MASSSFASKTEGESPTQPEQTSPTEEEQNDIWVAEALALLKMDPAQQAAAINNIDNADEHMTKILALVFYQIEHDERRMLKYRLILFKDFFRQCVYDIPNLQGNVDMTRVLSTMTQAWKTWKILPQRMDEEAKRELVWSVVEREQRNPLSPPPEPTTDPQTRQQLKQTRIAKATLAFQAVLNEILADHPSDNAAPTPPPPNAAAATPPTTVEEVHQADV